VIVKLSATPPEAVDAELLAVPFASSLSPLALRIDALVRGRLARLAEAATREAGASAVAHAEAGDAVAAARIALVGIGDGTADDLRSAAAAAARAAAGAGGTIVWAFDEQLGLDPDEQIRAVVEGALFGAHDPARWKTTRQPSPVERLVLAGADEGLQTTASRAEIVARWTNKARELVDAPPNEITPEGLARATATLLDERSVAVELLEPRALEQLGLRAMAAVGAGSANPPRLIVLRYTRRGTGPLGLVGKAITFDSGGFFLKPQSDIVRQKADMAGGAAVIAAVGAIAELSLDVDVIGVVPAAENMIGGSAYRPGDIVRTAAGLTVEVTNPDAEGRLVLADALWYAKREGATRLVDLATLTGAMRAGMGDMYSGVFANDEAWRTRVVAAGQASGDHAWPWPLHSRYRKLLDSQLADLRNTAGVGFGYPIIAAAFLERFAKDTPWAHIDILSTAYLDMDRDYFGRGATGAGVRLLLELAHDLARAQPNE
jgi:leucyl aminopeptidase